MFRLIIDYILIKRSNTFDCAHYLAVYPDVRKADIDPLWHYVKHGWREDRNPSPSFDTKYYITNNPELKFSLCNPLVHFIRYGRKQGITPHPRFEKSVNSTISLNYGDQIQKNRQEINRNSQEITLFFHVGDTKTGSSIIQNFLDVNRTNLIKIHKCLYPNLFSKKFGQGRSHNHGEWYKMLTEEKSDTFKNDIIKIIEYAKSQSISKIVLSFEGWLLDGLFIQYFKQLVKENVDFNYVVICYIRRTDLWCESAWKQWGLKNSISLSEYINDPVLKIRMKHTAKQLEKLSQIIGIENIFVRPYENQQLKNGIINDFLSLIGIDYLSHEWNKTDSINLATNQGFNRDALEILHHCHELFTDTNDNNLFDLFSTLLENQFRKEPFESNLLLSPEERIQIREMNLPFENEIAKKYLGRENGLVFYDPYPSTDEPWIAYEGINLERALPILVKLIYETNKRVDDISIKLNKSNIRKY